MRKISRQWAWEGPKAEHAWLIRGGRPIWLGIASYRDSRRRGSEITEAVGDPDWSIIKTSAFMM